jgi:predicted MarR family transcription regulator
MALLASIAAFAHVIDGLTNKSLRTHIAVHWRPDYTSAQASYDLRRLRLKGFIERVAGTNTYRVTTEGLRIAAFFTHLADRVIVPALTDLATPTRPHRSAPRPLTTAWRTYERELKILLRTTRLVA